MKETPQINSHGIDDSIEQVHLKQQNCLWQRHLDVAVVHEVDALRRVPRPVLYGAIDLCGVPVDLWMSQSNAARGQWRAKFHILTVNINTDLTVGTLN